MKTLKNLCLGIACLTIPIFDSCEEMIPLTKEGFIVQEIYKGENNCTNRFIKEFDTAYASYNLKIDTNLLMEDKGSYVSKLWGYFFGINSPEFQSNQLGWHIKKRDSINFTSDSLDIVHYIRDEGMIKYKILKKYGFDELKEGLELKTSLSSIKNSHFASIIDINSGEEYNSEIKTKYEIPINNTIRKSHFYYGGSEYINKEGDTIDIKALKNLKLQIK